MNLSYREKNDKETGGGGGKKKERERREKMSSVGNLAERIQKCQSEIPLAGREARQGNVLVLRRSVERRATVAIF